MSRQGRAAVAGDDEGDIGEDFFDSANRNRRTNVEQASAVSVTASERGPLRVERLSTEQEQNRTTPSRHASTNHVYEVASTSPRSTPAGRPKQKTKLRAWAPTSPSASAQDAKHSAAQDYGDRGRDLNSYTFLLQQRMGSPSTSGYSRSPSRVGSQPRVEVFTSTLHTVFMAFANRTTLTMGKTGFRRFGIECPGLIRPLSRSRK